MSFYSPTIQTGLGFLEGEDYYDGSFDYCDYSGEGGGYDYGSYGDSSGGGWYYDGYGYYDDYGNYYDPASDSYYNVDTGSWAGSDTGYGFDYSGSGSYTETGDGAWYYDAGDGNVYYGDPYGNFFWEDSNTGETIQVGADGSYYWVNSDGEIVS